MANVPVSRLWIEVSADTGLQFHARRFGVDALSLKPRGFPGDALVEKVVINVVCCPWWLLAEAMLWYRGHGVELLRGCCECPGLQYSFAEEVLSLRLTMWWPFHVERGWQARDFRLRTGHLKILFSRSSTSVYRWLFLTWFRNLMQSVSPWEESCVYVYVHKC